MKAIAVAASLLLATPALAQTFYISDQQNGITALDGSTLQQTGRFDVGGKIPRGIAVTHDGKYLLTANQASGDLSVIERATGKLRARIPVGPSAEMVRTEGDNAYVTFEPPSDKGGRAQVAVIDLKTLTVTATLPSGHETEGLEFTADGKSLLVTNEGDDTISVYALPGGERLREVPTAAYGSRPRGIKRSPDGRFYVVSLETSNRLLIFDNNLTVTQTVPTAAGPYGLAFSPDGQRLFVAAARAGLIQTFDAKTFQHQADIKVGKRCWHFSFTQDGKRILAACGRSDALYVIDATGPKAVETLFGFAMPWGVVAYPNTSGTLDAP